MPKNSAERLIAAASCCAALLLCGTAAAQPEGYELARVDLEGNKEVLGLLEQVFAPRVSPDGERVVFESPETSASEGVRLWIAELSDLDSRRTLPSVGGPRNWAAVWTPDGERLVFLVTGAGPDAIYWQSADGIADAEHLVDGRSAESWVPDGPKLTYLTLRGDGDYGISLLDMASRTTRTWIDTTGNAEHSSNVSPGGDWIAYASNETERFEVWVAPVSDPGDRHRVTRQGGGHPLWSPDGGTLYFDRDNRLFEVEIDTDDAEGVVIGEPRELPIAGFIQGEYRRQFDLMPDGRAFLMLFPATASGASSR